MSFLGPKSKPAPSFLGTAATMQTGAQDPNANADGGFKSPTPPTPPSTITPAPGKPKLKSSKPTLLGAEATANPAYSVSKPGFGTNTLLGHG